MRVIIAVLVSVAVAARALAIKCGTVWTIHDWSISSVLLLDVATFTFTLALVA